MKVIQPEEWERPRGYSNGILAEGEFLVLAGQIGWNEKQQLVSDQLSQQVRQALQNVVQILKVANVEAEHLVRLTWYVTDLNEYRSQTKEIGKIYREVIGKHYPAMSLVQVAGLLEDGAKVEIEATAVRPRKRPS